jgi:hypothetical protein
MKRKEFILKSSGALAALSVTSLLKAGLQTETPSSEEEILVFEEISSKQDGGFPTNVTQRFKIPASALNCSIEELELQVSQLPANAFSFVDAKVGVYNSEVKKCKDMGAYVRLTCCPYEWTKGQGLLDRDEYAYMMNKISFIELYVNSNKDEETYINLLDKKKRFIRKVNKYVPPKEENPMEDIDTSDCFLTTVCVQHKGLEDNCFELQTLRNFRDTFISQSDNGEYLIDKYYKIGPRVVKKIKANANREGILEGMYTDLILPTIALIESGKLTEAKDYYVSYTLCLDAAC